MIWLLKRYFNMENDFIVTVLGIAALYFTLKAYNLK